MRWFYGLSVVVVFSLSFLCACVFAQTTTSKQDCMDCPELVSIPAGHFIMGVSADEEEREHISKTDVAMAGPVAGRALPQHPVAVHAFAIGKYPVTRREFAAFVYETGYVAGNACMVWHVIPDDGSMQWKLGHVKWEMKRGASWRDPGFPQTDRDPVVCVSWDDAKAYIAWLTKKSGQPYRLPTEAEWEYVTRAGAAGARYWGDKMEQACKYENVADLSFASVTGIDKSQVFPCTDGYAYTSPVGKFQPNAFGVYDTLGNVAQWTEDCANHTYVGAPADGSAWLSGDCGSHAMRGPSYRMAVPNVRSGARDWVKSGERVSMYGFRVAKSE